MRAKGGLALLLLVGCAGEDAPAAPDPATVNALVEVQLAEARAASAGGDPDSARVAALAAHGYEPTDLDRWLDRAAGNPAAAEALWDAVAGQLDAERLAGSR
jgi:hypothetical protein